MNEERPGSQSQVRRMCKTANIMIQPKPWLTTFFGYTLLLMSRLQHAQTMCNSRPRPIPTFQKCGGGQDVQTCLVVRDSRGLKMTSLHTVDSQSLLENSPDILFISHSPVCCAALTRKTPKKDFLDNTFTTTLEQVFQDKNTGTMRTHSSSFLTMYAQILVSGNVKALLRREPMKWASQCHVQAKRIKRWDMCFDVFRCFEDGTCYIGSFTKDKLVAASNTGSASHSHTSLTQIRTHAFQLPFNHTSISKTLISWITGLICCDLCEGWGVGRSGGGANSMIGRWSQNHSLQLWTTDTFLSMLPPTYIHFSATWGLPWLARLIQYVVSSVRGMKVACAGPPAKARPIPAPCCISRTSVQRKCSEHSDWTWINRNKCHASSNRCLTSSNKKLLETSATPKLQEVAHAETSPRALYEFGRPPPLLAHGAQPFTNNLYANTSLWINTYAQLYKGAHMALFHWGIWIIMIICVFTLCHAAFTNTVYYILSLVQFICLHASAYITWVQGRISMSSVPPFLRGRLALLMP